MESKKDANELTDLDVLEVSLVGSPANKRKFLLLKNQEGFNMDEERNEELEDKDISKSLTEEHQNAVKGAMNLLKKVPNIKDILGQLAKFISGGTSKKEEDEKVPEAKEVDKELTQKSEDTEIKLVTLEKERDGLKARIEDLEKADRRRQLEVIAKTFDGKSEDNLAYLEGLAENLPQEKLDKVIEREQLHAKRLTESELFTEKGSSRPSVGSAEEKIMNLVNERVQKGEDKLKVFSDVMAENPELYGDYLRETNKQITSNEE